MSVAPGLVERLREWTNAAHEQGERISVEATPNYSAEERADIKASFYMQRDLLNEAADAAQHRDDLAMLMKRILYRHGKGKSLADILAGAADYLTRKKLHGSILRDDGPLAPAATSTKAGSALRAIANGSSRTFAAYTDNRTFAASCVTAS